MANQRQSLIPQQCGNARGLSPLRSEGFHQGHCSDHWLTCSHFTAWTLRWLLKCCQETLQCQKTLAPQNPSQAPGAGRRQFERMASQEIKWELSMSVLSTSLLLSGGLCTPWNSCRHHSLGRTKDVSAGAEGGLAAQETTVLKAGGLSVVFGEREGKGEMYLRYPGSWTSHHLYTMLRDVTGSLSQMFRQFR